MSEHIDFLTDHFDLKGKHVCDIGAGSGAFAALLNKLGAIATAVEINPEQLEKIRETYGDSVTAYEGVAEALPVSDNSQDLVCMMFSLHHVPLDHQERAISEIVRVLKPGGRLHVADPRPYGKLTDVLLHVDDETLVRTASQQRMSALPSQGDFELVSEVEYTLSRTFTDFDELLSNLVLNEPSRAERLPDARHDMQKTFKRLADRTEKGWSLDQPCVAYHFKKIR